MLRLYRFIFTLVIVSTALTLAARGIGGVQRSPLAILFSKPDGSLCEGPCMFGIRPGQTTSEDAIVMLKSHPATRDLEILSTSPFLMGDTQAGPIIMFSAGPNDLITAILVSEGSLPKTDTASRASDLVRSVSLGDVSSALGRADLVWLGGGDFYVNYLGDDIKVLFYARSNKTPTNFEHVPLRLPASRFMLSTLVDCKVGTLSRDFAPWAGFTTFGRYRETQHSTRSLHFTELQDKAFCR